MSKQSDSVKAARAAKQKAERLQRMGSTYRQFVFAGQGAVPPGVCYELPADERELWCARAEQAFQHLVAFGLVQP